MGLNEKGLFAPELDEDSLWAQMVSVFSGRLGATSALYGFVPSAFWLGEDRVTESIVFRHNHPQEVLGEGPSSCALDNEPSVLRLRQDEPWFLWHEAIQWPGVTLAQRARFSAGNPASNVGVSIRMPFFEGRAVAGLGFCALGTSAEAFAARWHADVDGHLALARQFDAAMRPRMIANRFKLSKREVSVMRLLAVGLTAKLVADKLGLQPKTVFNVMDRARKSLKASTTMEAVTKALAFRLI